MVNHHCSPPPFEECFWIFLQPPWPSTSNLPFCFCGPLFLISSSTGLSSKNFEGLHFFPKTGFFNSGIPEAEARWSSQLWTLWIPQDFCIFSCWNPRKNHQKIQKDMMIKNFLGQKMLKSLLHTHRISNFLVVLRTLYNPKQMGKKHTKRSFSHQEMFTRSACHVYEGAALDPGMVGSTPVASESVYDSWVTPGRHRFFKVRMPRHSWWFFRANQHPWGSGGWYIAPRDQKFSWSFRGVITSAIGSYRYHPILCPDASVVTTFFFVSQLVL